MASEITSDAMLLSTRQGEAAQAQFYTSDYGAVGDQRPYQIVQPSYPAPKWLGRFAYLTDALRECGTLCALTGQPFRLMKWGDRVPCYPCKGQRRDLNRLPNLRIHSPGALEGFPECRPIADFKPRSATLVYGADGQPKLVGGANFVVSRTPTPPSDFIEPGTLPVHYLEAVKSAQFLAGQTGRPAFICSSLGGSCKPRGRKKNWVPVAYVQPGGLAQRYPGDLRIKNSVPGSQVGVSDVTEDEFRELIRESEGGSFLPKGV